MQKVHSKDDFPIRNKELFESWKFVFYRFYGSNIGVGNANLTKLLVNAI